MSKSNVNHIRIALVTLAISSFCITLLMYTYNFNYKFEKKKKITTTESANVGRPMKHISLKDIYDQIDKAVSEDDFLADDYKAPLLIDNPGCQIPIFYVDYTMSLNKTKKHTCGNRAILLKRIDEERVSVSIQERRIKKYMTKSPIFQCSYRFISLMKNSGKIKFGPFTKIKHGMIIELETDFINVMCFENEMRHPSARLLYKDMYAFTKKLDTSKLLESQCIGKYNILMLGIDSMSLSRLGQTMQRTINFFRDNFWLAYRGFHKVEDNTLPNLMAVLTGKNLSVLNDKCSERMDECNHLLIWSKFKEAGYVTAYGEDYINLPDTFHDEFLFLRSPTDHYLRPLFMMDESESNSLICAGKQLSGQQLLDYALDFVMTYRQQPFFGFFWINSFSHNANSRPEEGDLLIENFLNRLSYTGVLENTFVIFFSDHGIRFGNHRLTIESYYDERLPILFIWSPAKFKSRYPIAFKNLVTNQFRLVTPYDLHKTLMDINRITICNSSIDNNTIVSETCPNCHSMFLPVSGNRKCQDVAIHEKWCSCHKLNPLDIADPEGIRSAMYVVSYIESKVKSVVTVKDKQCWVCMNLTLQKINRIHFYYDVNKVNLYHVVALTMTPGNLSYEATVLRKGMNPEIVGKVSVLSPYKGLGHCTVAKIDKLFCVCQETKKCPDKIYDYEVLN